MKTTSEWLVAAKSSTSTERASSSSPHQPFAVLRKAADAYVVSIAAAA